MNIGHAAGLNKTKIGTCPHGLPLGACPICNGMGGGGGGSKKADKAVGEMSYDQCYAVWQQMLKAKELAEQRKQDAMHTQMQANISFSAKLNNLALKSAELAQNLTGLTQRIQNLPKIISTPIILTAKIATTVLNIVQNVVVITQKVINFVQQKFADISDKLNAIFGELKNAIEKKISDKLKDFKKKVKSLFGIIEPEYVDDEEKKIEESKRLFKFKTSLHSIKERLTNKTDASEFRQERR